MFITNKRFLEGNGVVQIPAIKVPIDHMFDMGCKIVHIPLIPPDGEHSLYTVDTQHLVIDPANHIFGCYGLEQRVVD